MCLILSYEWKILKAGDNNLHFRGYFFMKYKGRGFDFPSRIFELKDFKETIDRMPVITDDSVESRIETDFRIAAFLKYCMPSDFKFFKSRDGLNSPYRFARSPMSDSSVRGSDSLGSYSIAGIVEAYLLGEDKQAGSLKDVKRVELFSFFAPTFIDSRKGFGHYYQEGVLGCVDFERLFDGEKVDDYAIKNIVHNNYKIAVCNGSVFVNFDLSGNYAGQRNSIIRFFDDVKAKKKEIIDAGDIFDDKKNLPEAMYQEGLSVTVPKYFEEIMRCA